MTITPGPSVTRHGVVHRRGQQRRSATARSTRRATSRAASTAATTLNQAVGRRRDRDPARVSTNGRVVGDELVIDTGANAETVKIASIPTPAPASPNPNVTLTAPLTKAHAANAAIQAIRRSTATIAVPIDTQPADRGLARRRWSTTAIGHGAGADHADAHRSDARLGQPRRARDAGSTARGSTRCRSTPSKLSLGKHTWTLGITDIAGNGNKVTFTFLVTTSFADIDALLARFGTAGTIPAADGHHAARLAGRRQGVRRRRRQGRGHQRAGRVRRAGPRAVANADAAQPAGHRRPGRHPPGARHPGRRGAGRPRHHVRALPPASRATRT